MAVLHFFLVNSSLYILISMMKTDISEISQEQEQKVHYFTFKFNIMILWGFAEKRRKLYQLKWWILYCPL